MTKTSRTVFCFSSDNRKSVLSLAEGSAIQSLSRTAIRDPKWAGLFAIVIAVTLCGARVQAQQPARIAYFSASSAASQTQKLESLKQGLRALGYVEGKDIVVEERYAEGKLDRAGAIAAELVGLKLDAIVTGGPAATRA